ncbi:hypothetical protein V6N11_051464 [Hibiscus sabdariffa]|uniref:Pentatricopeptide repeat-containing protein n=1 Tax=Hibiscus sabdariffa TaxID=183260 RepID=A0ABR2U774_9ROSI
MGCCDGLRENGVNGGGYGGSVQWGLEHMKEGVDMFWEMQALGLHDDESLIYYIVSGFGICMSVRKEKAFYVLLIMKNLDLPREILDTGDNLFANFAKLERQICKLGSDDIVVTNTGDFTELNIVLERTVKLWDRKPDGILLDTLPFMISSGRESYMAGEVDITIGKEKGELISDSNLEHMITDPSQLVQCFQFGPIFLVLLE